LAFTTIYQRWMDFLNRHAIGAHLLVLPISMLIGFLVWAIPAIGDHPVTGNHLLEQFFRAFILLMFRIIILDPGFSRGEFLVIFILFYSYVSTYCLLCHIVLYTYRNRDYRACVTILATTIIFISIVFGHEWYCKRCFEQADRYSRESMPLVELFWKCGLPLCYTIDPNGSIRACYTNGVTEKNIDIAAPYFWATATISGTRETWRD